MSHRDSDYQFVLSQLAEVKNRLARIEREKRRPSGEYLNEQEAIHEVLQMDPVDDVDKFLS